MEGSVYRPVGDMAGNRPLAIGLARASFLHPFSPFSFSSLPPSLSERVSLCSSYWLILLPQPECLDGRPELPQLAQSYWPVSDLAAAVAVACQGEH